MTNNNTTNERENEMTFDHFDTVVTNEETQAYSDYVDAEALAAIEADEENWEDVESDDGHRDLYDDDFDVSFDDMVDSFTQFDDQRDLDYYES
tara:strand:- start:90 stop:368 length:279 start_codon:yes stop_codon:yes gene_type:complete